jgi:hypothetical protein
MKICQNRKDIPISNNLVNNFKLQINMAAIANFHPCQEQKTIAKKRVWFPEDAAGEPHPQNPDDGCGGALYKNATIHLIYATSDHGPPDNEMSNVLEGKSAKLAHKAERKCADYNDTANLYRDAGTKIPRFGGIDHSDKLAIWLEFEMKYNQLKEPDWSIAGLLWRSLFGREPRFEEEFPCLA